MTEPTFVQLHCTNSDNLKCATCGRDFIVPVGSIAGVFRMPDGRAEVLLQFTEFCVDPNCFGSGQYRFIKTNDSWESVVEKLDGKVANIGNFSMVQEDF